MKKQGYMPKSKSQTHLTPDRVFEIIEEVWGIERSNFYDPFPPYTPYKSPCFFNGFYGDWQPYNYVNSPFESKILSKAVVKSFEQKDKDNVTVLLAPVKTDQDWFQQYIVPLIKSSPNNIHFIAKRLKFKNDKDSSMSSHFLVLIE